MMRIQQRKNCHVFLIGAISTMPLLIDETSGEIAITINRMRVCPKNRKIMSEEYRVILSTKDAMHIQQAGFLGATVAVQGDMRKNNETDILAENVQLIGSSNTAQSEMSWAEKSYWFGRDGGIRSELMNIH